MFKLKKLYGYITKVIYCETVNEKNYLKARAQKDVTLLLFRVVHVFSFDPVVANRVGENQAIVTNGTRRDRLLHLERRLQVFALVFIPKRECSIRASSGHRSMFRVELNSIHGGRWMTLEFKIILWKQRRRKKYDFLVRYLNQEKIKLMFNTIDIKLEL